MTYGSLCAGAASRHLAVVGAFHPGEGDLVPKDTETLVLLGPDPAAFWTHFTRSPEYLDTKPDPMDRWSARVIGQWADSLGAQALFPFGGPPYQPFLRWAEASGRAWQSPTGPLVHDTMGMMISYRGALALRDRIALPPPVRQPCASCADKPCLSACPVAALSDQHLYDVPRCKAHMRIPEGSLCLSGCLVRRACPISAGAGRTSAQSEFHMSNFLGSP